VTKKTKTITLRSGFNPKATGPGDRDARGYVVTQITSSRDYAPGDFVTVNDALQLRDSPNWKVTIKS
jgi:hypothetical protein